jgi:hypothetical protein
MTLPAFAHHTVTRVRPTWILERGSQKADYDHPASLLTIWGCILEPLPSADAAGDQAATLFEQHLMLPPGSDLTATDLVVFGVVSIVDWPTWVGVKYGVHGDPQRVGSPTGAVDYMECRVRAWVHG